MRTLIFGAILIAVASVGFNTLISASLAAARDAKPGNVFRLLQCSSLEARAASALRRWRIGP